MNTENRCAQCPGACCKDAKKGMSRQQFSLFNGHLPIKAEELSRSDLEMIAALGGWGNTQSRVFYTEETRTNLGEAEIIVLLRNHCPFYDPTTHGCDAYGQPYRPPACQNLVLGGQECNAARTNSALPPVSSSIKLSFPE